MTTLVREENGKEIKVKRYYHKVLEAKLVLAENIVISLDTEFIENESEKVSKNDCEINAAESIMWKELPARKRRQICTVTAMRL